MNILQVSTWDMRGGAEKIAWTLHQEYQKRGHGSWLAVGYKRSEAADVFVIPNACTLTRWEQCWEFVKRRIHPLTGHIKGMARLYHWCGVLEYLPFHTERRFGLENFHFPGTRQLLHLPPHKPDILHCHNLHGGYFDLRLLPRFSRQLPVLLSLHDTWLLSGHCAYFFDCTRWETSCGHCPNLTIYPSIVRDATAFNWRSKRRIYAHSRVYVATPCHWLQNLVERSMLAPAIREMRVIPYGIDLVVFQPANKQEARAALGIPPETQVLLFAANGIRQHPFKDYHTIREAVAIAANKLKNRPLLFLALGEDGPPEQLGHAQIKFMPHQQEPKAVARFYQAADVFLHAAKADTFPNTILEALACGTPVVATTVGGIPEQIEHEKTGLLVAPGDAVGMAQAIHRLLTDHTLWQGMSANAHHTAQERFDLTRMVNAYLAWYQEICETHS